jgi:hypothetical protein
MNTEIKAVYRNHIENRGLDEIFHDGAMEHAVEVLTDAHKIMIITGFPIKEAGIGENDGPPGSIILARALEQLGKEVCILSDRYSESMLTSGLEVVDSSSSLVIASFDADLGYFHEIIDTWTPDVLVAIERPGKGADGHFHSMNGTILDDMLADTDLLFKAAQDQSIKTIAIGDGGNELGMGKFKREIQMNVKHGDKIASELSADDVIVSSVSNWGAMALVAAISMRVQIDLLCNQHRFMQIMTAIHSQGAVDGVTKKNAFSVDGYALDENLDVFNRFKEIIKKETQHNA